MRIAIIDCETTGLDTHDQPISIAVLFSEIDDLGVARLTDIWYGEQYPSVPISKSAFSVHGRTEESLHGKFFDFEKLINTLNSTDLIIAHNADFDYKMIAKVCPEIRNLPWFCSYKQWPFGDLPNKKLDTLCNHLGIERPLHHDAMSDVRSLYAALNMHTGKNTRSKTYLHRLIKNDAWIKRAKNSSPANNAENEHVKIHSFNRNGMKNLPVGSKIPFENNLNSDHLVAYQKKIFSGTIPLLTILKSENPRIAEIANSGHRIYLQITENDGGRISLCFNFDSPVA